jgi:hypothetical protein
MSECLLFGQAKRSEMCRMSNESACAHRLKAKHSKACRLDEHSKYLKTFRILVLCCGGIVGGCKLQR